MEASSASLPSSSQLGEQPPRPTVSGGGGGNAHPRPSSATRRTCMEALLRYTRVFARMNPSQKVSSVEVHMQSGITGMCGDGANDAGALRTAHAGLALASHSAEATIVAPFSTPSEETGTLTDIIREGRCALANSMAGYKNLIVYGEVICFVSFLQYYFGIILSEAYWITVDSLINIGMAWAILQAKPCATLKPHRPTSALLGIEVVTSLCVHIFWNWLFMALLVIILFHQSFFVCREFDPNLIDTSQWWLRGDNYESAALAVLSMVQLVSAAATFNFGFDYRRRWICNYGVVLLWGAALAWCCYLLFANAGLFTCLYRVGCGDHSLLQRFHSLGIISYPWSDGANKLPTAPAGCPCSMQVLPDTPTGTCESEYTDACTTHNRFNQTYHHNIFPVYFKLVIFLVAVANVSVNFLFEGCGIVGPLRRYLRKKKYERSLRRGKRRKPIIGNDSSIGPDHDYETTTTMTTATAATKAKEAAEGGGTSFTRAASPPTPQSFSLPPPPPPTAAGGEQRSDRIE
eukprot:GHVU01207294.1.p1 GENE.GHVU01207294.1~~GHVU01207294.1.p1  ORF type:complete len:584 (-),score=103.17 GHVU01207294.1:1048-2601(-)